MLLLLLLSLLFVSLSISASTIETAVFRTGDLVEWVVDLEAANPNGILCKTVEAHLTDAKYHEIHLTETAKQHPDIDFAFQMQVETGIRYKLKWTIPSTVRSRHYQFTLWCTDPKNARSRSLLATSQLFQITNTLEGTDIQVIGESSLKDISPLPHYEEHSLLCPIGFDRMNQPVYDGYNTMEAQSLLKYFQDFSIPARGTLESPFRYEISRLHFDDQMLAKSQKFSVEFIRNVIDQNGWCFAEEEAQSFNLQTRKISSCPFSFSDMADQLKHYRPGAAVEAQIQNIERSRTKALRSVYTNNRPEFIRVAALLFMTFSINFFYFFSRTEMDRKFRYYELRMNSSQWHNGTGRSDSAVIFTNHDVQDLIESKAQWEMNDILMVFMMIFLNAMQLTKVTRKIDTDRRLINSHFDREIDSIRERENMIELMSALNELVKRPRIEY